MASMERHVLYVDNDAQLREAITNLLRGRGVGVTTAADGAQAIALMQDGLWPDVIIADLDLPNMDGFAFFDAVRENDAWLPIPFIALCAHDEKSVMRRALMCGMDDFIVKPLDDERLLLTIYSKAKRTQELTRYADAAHATLAYVRRDMARMFTHELRTPLVSMNMVSELLTRSQLGDLTGSDLQDLIETLQAGVTRLNRLMEQMVLLIQLDTGEMQKLIDEASSPGPLWDALTAAVSQARTFTYRQRDIEVIYHHNDIAGNIQVEWKSLRHALAELLSNAMAFSPKDQPVTVTQRLEGSSVALSITDRGPGIPEDRQRDLFRRFNQLEREKHDQQGIGMGLYLARSIIEASGGSLELTSASNRGTTVTVYFPLIVAPIRSISGPLRETSGVRTR
jgi:signal transduction histidine kinase